MFPGQRGTDAPDADYVNVGDDWPILAADVNNTGRRANSGISEVPTTRWRVTSGRPFDAGAVVEDGMVFAGTEDGQVLAVDEATGEVAWKTEVDARRLVEPVASGDGIVVAGRGDGFLSVLSRDDGSLAFAVDSGETRAVTEAPTVNDGVCYVPVDVQSGDQTRGRLVAIDLEAGDKEWELDFPSPISTPALSDGELYVGTVDGTLVSVDSRRVERNRIARTEGNVTCPPTVVDGVVYCGGMNGVVHAFDTRNTGRTWTTQLQRPVRASPAVDEKSVYAMDMGGTVVRINRRSGETAWEFQTAPVTTARSISLVGEIVYVPTDRGVVGIDKNTGSERWQWSGGNVNHSAPAVANGTVYLTSTEGDVVAVS
ncbi:PQQ-binding-like beta-propeller repeat protein [Halorubellus litoreus]|uniref:PQQ-binding-like beta-propeller repeat protein n=1 Tax=Halorubellus litoreus TaxID=755308 RepID=A0ABD5VEQ0_9EURY